MYRTPYNRLIQHGDVEGETEAQQHFEEFYQDIFIELSKFGVVEELHVCQNLGAHLNGNVYVKYQTEEDAANALANTNGRVYDGIPIYGELSPVTDFKEARCRQYDVGECTRGGYCNFMHLREPNKELKTNLFVWQRHCWKERGRRGIRMGSESPDYRRSYRRRSPDRRQRRRRSRSRESSRDKRYRSRSRDYERSRDGRSRSREKRRRDRSRDRSKERDRSHERRRRDRRDRSRDRSKERRDSSVDRGRKRVKTSSLSRSPPYDYPPPPPDN